MPAKSKLKVQAVRKVYQPHYPAYSDKNPLEYPGAYPYPFSKNMLRALSVTGFSGALLLGALTACDTPAPTVATKNNTKDNPFPFAVANLPYTPVMFGTGLPSRLKREDAIDFINQAFQKEGLEVTYDTTLEVNGIRIPVNAYNERYRLGYIWMDYTNFGEGMADLRGAYRTRGLSQKEMEKNVRKTMEEYWEYYQRSPEEFVKNAIYGNSEATEEFRRALKNDMPLLQSDVDKKHLFKEKYIPFALSSYKHSPEKEAPVYAQLTYQIPKRVSEPFEALALIRRFQNSINRYSREARVGIKFTDVFNGELKNIRDTKRQKEWRKRLESLIQLLDMAQHYYFVEEGHPVLEKIQRILEIPDWHKRKKEVASLQLMIDRLLIDLKEAKKIDRLSGNGELYIAPISARDERTIIREETWQLSMLDEQLINLYRKHKTSDSEVEKDSLSQEIKLQEEASREQRKARADSAHFATLQRLEDDVRQYIRWAKEQQGY